MNQVLYICALSAKNLHNLLYFRFSLIIRITYEINNVLSCVDSRLHGKKLEACRFLSPAARESGLEAI